MVIQDLSLSFEPGKPIVDGVSCEIQPGSVAVFLGPNGCGKTSLLDWVAGVFRGKERAFGPSTILPDPTTIGYVPQDLSRVLLDWYSPIDNVAFPIMWRKRLPRAVARAQALATLNDWGAGLNPSEVGSFTQHLSGGKRAMVAIAREAVRTDSFLLLDEGLSSLDLRRRVHVMNKLRIWARERNVGVIAVTHSYEDAIYGADVVIRLGGNPTEVLEVWPVQRSAADFQGLTDPEFAENVASSRARIMGSAR